MARTTAPLLGFDAQGQIAKTMVYAKWRGVNYARRHVIPANPNTSAQQTTRTTFATLREYWKVMATDGRAPWEAFATGRPFLGLNAFVGENLRVVRGDANMNDFLGSPGARGGLPASSITASTGTGSGEVDLDVVYPTAPSGWTITEFVGVAFPDHDPAVDLVGPVVVAKVSHPTTTITFTGLGSAVACQASGWIVWTKPNGQTAYSVSVTDQATSQT